MDNAEALEQEMIQVGHIFLQTTQDDLVRVHELVDAIARCDHGSDRELFELTHRIGGTAAMLGFAALSQRVAELESAARAAVVSQHDTEADDSVRRTQRMLERVEGELTKSFELRLDRWTSPLLSKLRV